MRGGAAANRTAALIPVRSLEGAKSRLGEVLDAEEREALVRTLLRRTIAAARDAGAEPVVVISDDDRIRALAAADGAVAVPQGRPGLNAALEDGRRHAIERGAAILLVLPGDLPLVDAATVSALAAAAAVPAGSGTDGPPVVVLVPDRHGRGTNGLALRPPDAIPFAFGEDSRAAHERLARQAGARYVEMASPLAVDVDTPEDLLLVDEELAASGAR